MISLLARTATWASGGSAGAGPIATISGTGCKLILVVRPKTWPRKNPSMFSDVSMIRGRSRLGFFSNSGMSGLWNANSMAIASSDAGNGLVADLITLELHLGAGHGLDHCESVLRKLYV